MLTVAEWARALKESVDAGRQGHMNMARVVSPGFAPLDGTGFVAFQGLGPIFRAGMPPEALSVLLWPSTTPQTAGDALNDFTLNLGGAFTFITDRRIEVLNELSAGMQGTDKKLFLPLSDAADRRLVSPLRSDDLVGGLKQLASQLASLPNDAEIAISTALNMHYGAVLLFDRDLAAAYTLLVAGIEVLSRQFGEPPTEWAAWDRATKWDRFATAHGLTEEQHEALKAELLKDQHLRLKQTFTNYVATRLPDGFWELEWQDYLYSVDYATATWAEGRWNDLKHVSDFVSQDKEALIAGLRKSYDARSGFVHQGTRATSLTGEIYNAIMRTSDGTRPLSFAVLRSVLTSLIRTELEEQAGDFELPNIQVQPQAPSEAPVE